MIKREEDKYGIINGSSTLFFHFIWTPNKGKSIN